jgi:hypothetical protein
MKTIRTNKRVAHKIHWCSYCYGVIKKGEVYESQTNTFEGELYTWKAHLSCQELASKLNMFDHCDEGVTADDFHEFVNEKYSDLNGPPELSWKERLQYIKDKVLDNEIG